jgi:hypothetical protein
MAYAVVSSGEAVIGLVGLTPHPAFDDDNRGRTEVRTEEALGPSGPYCPTGTRIRPVLASADNSWRDSSRSDPYEALLVGTTRPSRQALRWESEPPLRPPSNGPKMPRKLAPFESFRTRSDGSNVVRLEEQDSCGALLAPTNPRARTGAKLLR